jgi:hypothetical protein
MNVLSGSGIPQDKNARGVLMTRFEPKPSASRPAAEAEESTDSLLERWLAHSKASRPRLRHSGVPAPAPLGDDLADAWFK